jgi:hypothetical protein|nr:MAG: hypothetical protein [Lake Baikal virophage 1]
MSLSSASSYSNAGTAIIQHGVLTFVAGQTCTVPCPSIVASDTILLTVATSTAGAAAYVATLLNHLYTVVVTAGTGFTVVGQDALYAGTVKYTVLHSGLPSKDVTSV